MRLFFGLILLFYFITAAANDSQRFLFLSDIHFDPLLICTPKQSCPGLKKLVTMPISKWHDIFMTENNAISTVGQDTSDALLHSSLLTASKLCVEQQINLVIINGDFLAHHLQKRFKLFYPGASKNLYHDFLVKTFDYLHQEIKSAFANQQVIIVLGNNDAYTGDYHLIRQGEFFKDITRTWHAQLTSANTMQKEFPDLGFYTVQPMPNLCLIILNTTLFAMRYDNARNHNNALLQLHWLQQQLAAAKSAQQEVWLIMHIPESVDVYLTPHQYLLSLKQLWFERQQFDALLKQYAPNIVAIFTGHLHDKWYAFNQDKILQIALPAISPIFGNQPALQIISANQQHKITAIETYSLPIEQKNWRRLRGWLPPYKQGCERVQQSEETSWQEQEACQL